jgi:hypothetical protein
MDTAPIITHVEVKHVVTGGVWDCPVGFLDEARALGWHPTSVPENTAYDGWTVKELEAEIDGRNTGLEEAPVEGVEPLSKVGNKPDLIATLLADDVRRRDTNA